MAELVEPIHGSLAALAAALEPVSLGRTALTRLGAGQPISVVFDEGALGRVRAVKARVDPAGTIRGNHPLG